MSNTTWIVIAVVVLGVVLGLTVGGGDWPQWATPVDPGDTPT